VTRLRYVSRSEHDREHDADERAIHRRRFGQCVCPANLQVSPMRATTARRITSAPGSPFMHVQHHAQHRGQSGLLTNDCSVRRAATVTSLAALNGRNRSRVSAGSSAPAAGGTLTVNADGSLSFAPATGFAGLITFNTG